jgi:hypothetical protein
MTLFNIENLNPEERTVNIINIDPLSFDYLDSLSKTVR